MSADNYIGVIPTEDGKYGVIPYGNMSLYTEDCMYRGTIEGTYDTRADALVHAHDAYKEAGIVEYGVIELDPPPAKPCGRCFVCVHQRGIARDDLQKCDVCHKPISTAEWTTSWYDPKQDKTVTTHSSCEREVRVSGR